MAYDWKTELPGVFSRHADNCPTRDGGECTCGPLGYRSSIRDWQSNRRAVSPTFETAVEALAWQQDQFASNSTSNGAGVGRGDLGALIDEFLQAAEDGMARDGREQRYTRETVRALRGALSYAESELGSMDVQDIRRRHVQGLINQLYESGVAPTRIAAVTDSLQSLYAYAIRRELVGFSPLVELELPQQSENGVPHMPHAEPAELATEQPPPGWTSGELWTAPPPVGPPWTPPPFDAYSHSNGGFPTPPPQQSPPHPTPPPYPPPGYTAAYPPPYAQPGYATERPFAPPPPQPYGYGTLSGMLGAPTGQQNANASYDATMQERWLWWTVRIIVIVFVLIALVLAAESV